MKINIKNVQVHNINPIENTCIDGLLTQKLSNLSSSNTQYVTPKFTLLEGNIQSLLSNLIVFYAHAVYQSYSTRLTQLSSQKKLTHEEQAELKNLDTLTSFSADIHTDDDIHTESKKHLPLLTQLNCATENGIQNYAIYASASAIAELMQSKGAQKLKIAVNDNDVICGFAVSQIYAQGLLLDNKPATYVNQAGVLPLGKRTGETLVKSIITENSENSTILLTRTFNSSAKKCYSRMGFVEMQETDRMNMCSKLGYDGSRYTALQLDA
jgi:hypothetical protein